MRVRFLVNESGDNGTIKWRYRQGEILDADELPSGIHSAYRWQDMNVLEILEEEAGTQPPSSDVASQASGDDPGDTAAAPRRRGRPPKVTPDEAATAVAAA